MIPAPTEGIDEMGDVLWYYTLLMNTLGIEWDEIIQNNVAKLAERYPEKHRGLVSEFGVDA